MRILEAHPHLESRIVRYLVAAGIGLEAFAPSLPDGVPGSPRSILVALGISMIGVGVYLGAPKPE